MRTFKTQQWYEDNDRSIRIQYAMRYGKGARVTTWGRHPKAGEVTRVMAGTEGQLVWVRWADGTGSLHHLSELNLRQESPAMPRFAARPCNWLVEDATEDGPYTRDCGAPMRERRDGTGWDCDAGHEHTTAEARHAQGWDYAEDDDEAAQLARAGVEPRTLAEAKVWPR